MVVPAVSPFQFISSEISSSASLLQPSSIKYNSIKFQLRATKMKSMESNQSLNLMSL